LRIRGPMMAREMHLLIQIRRIGPAAFRNNLFRVLEFSSSSSTNGTEFGVENQDELPNFSSFFLDCR
jgi:hypothetical protein